MKKILITVLALLLATEFNAADRFVDFSKGELWLNKEGTLAIYVDKNDERGVERAVGDLAKDIYNVCGSTVTITNNKDEARIVVGTLGSSKAIDEIVDKGYIKGSSLKGKNEKYIAKLIGDQFYVVGSNRRGTIYGIYEISRQIGVSPWYWWADAPIVRHKNIYISKRGEFTDGEPSVKYRGIFINDESPSFTSWCKNKFGGVNSKMYSHMFELLLRLKANYLWPAMWGNAFNEDDAQSPVLADYYGIYMGTSHHEPMMRAHKEYTKRREEVGPWDYNVNKKGLDKFFRDGLERNKEFDNVITIGMRGDGDRALGKGDDTENIKSLVSVLEGQRKIISEVYKTSPANVPQLWAIYTEVQRYYDRGLSVSDDVIKLFCDNNWGYIRRTGPVKEQGKPMGLYYHIDMNGGPWNDRWVTTRTVPMLREQLNLAYQTGIDDLWVFNVGDLKPKELLIDFVMKYAWNPNAIQAYDVSQYMIDWARANFGGEHSVAIADIVTKYTKYNLMRKPEVQGTRIFSVVNHNEADRMEAMWNDVEHKADSIRRLLPEYAQSAYYQLVFYPAMASAGVGRIYLNADRNHQYARQGRVSANEYAKIVDDLYKRDKELEAYYNNELSNGKWKGMMQDRHFGYAHWWMPKKDSIPVMQTVSPLVHPAMGVVAEGSEFAADERVQVLPVFDNLDDQTYYIDVFNKGTGTIAYKAESKEKWVVIDRAEGTTAKDARLYVNIAWEKLSEGEHSAVVVIEAEGKKENVSLKAVKKELPVSDEPFYGSLTGAEFTIPAYGYADKTTNGEAHWTQLPLLGRDKANMGIQPVTAKSDNSKNAPRLDYNVYFDKSGEITLLLGVLPTQDVNPERGLRIAVAIDDNERVILDARQGMLDTFREYGTKALAASPVLKAVPKANRSIKLISGNGFCRNGLFDNIRWLDVKLTIDKPGMHKLHVYMVDPEVVVEKIVVNPDNNHPSYMGAPVKLHAKNI